MSRVVYNKLVRDKIPQIIRAQGRQPLVRALEDEEYLVELHRKLGEEVEEYLADGSLDELGDILAVLEGILFARGLAWADAWQAKEAKALRNGGFSNRVYLEAVIDGTEGR